MLAVTAFPHGLTATLASGVTLSQELPPFGLLRTQVLVGYRWQNIGLSPDCSGSTATLSDFVSQPSNPDRPVSRHPAFQFNPATGRQQAGGGISTPGRTSRSTAQPVAWGPPLCRRTRPHYSSRHLPSLVNPFLPISGSFPWRTFTMSLPLQQSVRLLRRLRPLCHTLACSRPLAGQGGLRVPQFQSRKLRVPRSMPALRRVDQRQHVRAMPKRHTPHHPFWARCISHFHLL